MNYLVGEAVHAALGVLDYCNLAGAEELGGDYDAAKRVRRRAAGLAASRNCQPSVSQEQGSTVMSRVFPLIRKE